jgi:hypothetical protein
MPKYSKVMVGCGALLIVCGLLGWGSAGFEAKAISAIIAGGATGIIMIGMGLLAASSKRAPMMIGIHMGILLPLLFGAMFAWRASKSWAATLAGEPKLVGAVIISVMAVVSLVTFIMVLRMRPKPSERGQSAASRA